MKTLICNNCVGAKIYQNLKQQYDNPFMWNLIDFSSYANLVEEFDDLDFTDISTRIVKDDKVGKNRNSVVLTLAGHIDVPFVHHHQDNRFSKPEKLGRDVYFKDIQSLVREQWNRRIARKMSKDILFIYVNRENAEYNQKFAELKTPHKKLLLTQYKNIDPKQFSFPIMFGLHRYYVLADRILNEHRELIV